MTRKTISIDKEIEAHLRDIQSTFIKVDTKSWSMSKIINMVLLSGMINSNQLSINDWNQLRSYMHGSKLDLKDADSRIYVENTLLVDSKFLIN